jgi:alkaline phosphatase D
VKKSRLAAAATLAAFLSAGGAAQQAPPDPAEGLRSGPMLGPAEIAETTIWLQTWAPRKAQIRFWEQGRPETSRLSGEVWTTAESDHIARFPLSGLRFGTRYEYEVYLDGGRVQRPYPLTFQTQAMWRWRTDPPAFRAALGSCAYVNEPPYDRPLTPERPDPYGGGYEIFNTIAAQKPDLMLWLGDNIYYREPDWQSETAMRRRWATDRSLAELQPLLGAVHNYAMWDDHDYGPNDSDRSFRDRETSLRVFQNYWMNPSYGTAGTPGVFTRFEWADVEFFLLDDRSHRSPNDAPAGPDKRMFGREQLRWLQESLSSSTATFKIVAGGNQILNNFLFFEGLAHFPQERRELLDYLREARIEGVVFLSGDRHHTELIRVQEPGLYPLYDFTSSPLTSGTAESEREIDNPVRVPGTFVRKMRNFGLLEVAGKLGERVLTLRTLDGKGRELWRHEIRESELRFPKKDLKDQKDLKD